MPVLYSNSRIFVRPVYIFNGRKQTLVYTIRILSALRMRGLHDKRHLLAKLHIAGSENWKINDGERARSSPVQLTVGIIWMFTIMSTRQCHCVQLVQYCPTLAKGSKWQKWHFLQRSKMWLSFPLMSMEYHEVLPNISLSRMSVYA